MKYLVMNIEDNEKKIALAEQQGKAFSEALDYMKNLDNHAEKTVEDYIISLASEEAEGTYQLTNGKLEWHTPSQEYNTHLEIVVRDKHDRRFIPNLQITAKICNEKDQLVVEKNCPFLWHPFLYHYGAMFKIPKEGKYTVEVSFPAPSFHRHDEVKGKKFEKGVSVKIPIQMETGREPYGPE
jgi:hypothetical protein